MLGKRNWAQEDLFVACSLRDLVPDDYVLKRVDKVMDFSWLREEVRDLYDDRMGRPSIDPEAAVRLMLAGFFHGIVHDRKLMREARMHIGIRWFAGFRLHEKLPHHSSLTRIRQRWGPERFKRIFQRTVTACVDAGLVDGETVHIDATLIRADVSSESLIEQHADTVIAKNEDGGEGPKKPGRPHMGVPGTPRNSVRNSPGIARLMVQKGEKKRMRLGSFAAPKNECLSPLVARSFGWKAGAGYYEDALDNISHGSCLCGRSRRFPGAQLVSHGGSGHTRQPV